MTRTLTISISDEWAAAIERAASAYGMTPEVIAEVLIYRASFAGRDATVIEDFASNRSALDSMRGYIAGAVSRGWQGGTCLSYCPAATDSAARCKCGGCWAIPQLQRERESRERAHARRRETMGPPRPASVPIVHHYDGDSAKRSLCRMAWRERTGEAAATPDSAKTTCRRCLSMLANRAAAEAAVETVQAPPAVACGWRWPGCTSTATTTETCPDTGDCPACDSCAKQARAARSRQEKCRQNARKGPRKTPQAPTHARPIVRGPLSLIEQSFAFMMTRATEEVSHAA